MSEKETLGGAIVNASPEIVFNIITAGINAAKSGDINFHRPSEAVGVHASNMSDELRAKLTTRTHRKVIFTYYSSKALIESANIKLACDVQYNGPEVLANFSLTADGMRSRLGTDTTIDIQNPLPLERHPAPAAWQAAGFRLVPVVYVPISVFVDEPTPHKNYKATFKLVLSGMAGFGATGGGEYVKDPVEFRD